MKPQILKTSALTKSFPGSNSAAPVINNLDTHFFKGEFTVIMGNSGSGKSTLLYLLSGLDKATSGKIWIDDFPVHNRTEKELALMRRQKVGFVFQDSNLVPNLTVKENILVAGRLVSKNSNQLNKRVDELLNDLGILPLANRMPGQLSGGEAQRCAMARALINDPVVIFADEPTGSLNSEASLKVMDCLDTIHSKGQSIVMVTHDLKSATYGDRILFFRDGQIVDERLRLGERGCAAEEEALFTWLKQKGW